MENTPNAAAAPATEATPNTNINTPVVDSTTPETPSQPDQFDSFVEANGGRDKVLEKMKQAIGDPKTYARNVLKDELAQLQSANQQPTNPANPTAQTSPEQQQTPAQPQAVKGGITPEEFMTQQYFSSLATQEKYATIQDEIRSGEVLKVLKQYDIPPMVNGMFNAEKVEGFLELYAKTKQPVAPADPITATPTVNYATFEGEVDSREKAVQIMSQGQGHPQYNAAINYMRTTMFPKQEKPNTTK